MRIICSTAIMGVIVVVLSIVTGLPARAQAMPSVYRNVERILGRTGTYEQNVLQIQLPRTDLSIAVFGQRVPDTFGLTGSLSMTRGSAGKQVMMGEIVLLQQEVNPVLSSLFINNLTVTAIHNHFLFETPRIIFMHIQGVGAGEDLARRVKPMLDMIGHVPPLSGLPDERNLDAQPPTGSHALNTATLDGIVGDAGKWQEHNVYQYELDRKDIHLVMNGAQISERMGLHIETQFYGTMSHAMIACEMALLPQEVAHVQRVLRNYGLDVTAVHNHMIGTNPEIIFVHFEANGPAEQLARAFHAAVQQTGARSR